MIIRGVLLLIFILLSPSVLHADLTGQGAIRENIDKKLSTINISELSNRKKQNLYADRLFLNLGMLIPVFGSYRLDTELYGNVRMPAYIFDWFLGGFLPLIFIAVANQKGISNSTRKKYLNSALSLYIGTRIGIFIAINEHIGTYNKYMFEKLNQKKDITKSLELRFTFPL